MESIQCPALYGILLPAENPSRKLDLQSEMEDDVSQHDCDKCACDGNPRFGFSKGIEKYHKTERHEQKAYLIQKRRIRRKGDQGDKDMTPFQASPRIRQHSLPAFAQYALDDEDDGKCSQNQT